MGAYADLVTIATGAATLAVGLYAWLSARGKANAAAVRALDERLDQVEHTKTDIVDTGTLRADVGDIERRVTKSEKDIEHLRGIHAEIKDVHTRVDTINEKLAELKGSTDAGNRTLSLIHKTLMEGARDK